MHQELLQQQRFILLVLVENVYVFVIAPNLVVIESESDDELVHYADSHIIKLHVLLVNVFLEKHRADFDLACAGFKKPLLQVDYRCARVDDILYDDRPAAVDVVLQADYLLYLPRGPRALIGRNADAGQFAGEGQALHQFAGKHDGAVKHADDQRNVFAALEVVVDFGGNGIDSLHYLLIRNIRNKVLVVKLYTVHGILCFDFAKISITFDFGINI